jgi:hypothetical protein
MVNNKAGRTLAILIHASVLVLLVVVASAAGNASAATLSFTPEVSSGLLGGRGSVNATLGLTGHEYGGFAAPTKEVVLRLPLGTMLSASGHPTCPETTIEPKSCPEGSMAGPAGSGRAVVSFGNERVEEHFELFSFYAPSGGLYLFLFGRSPVSLEAAFQASIVGNVVSFPIPLVETVPGAPDMSITELTLHLGTTYPEEEGSHLASGLTLPAECPAGKFSWSAALKTAGLGGLPEETDEQTAETECPATEEARRRHDEAVVAKKKAEEAAAAEKQAEEAAAVKKHQEEEAALKELEAAVKTLQAEARASVRVQKFKVTARNLLVTIKMSEPGAVTITGPGLKKTFKTLIAGTHQVTVALTKTGKAERKEREKIKLSVSLKVDSKTVSTSQKVKL